MRDIRDPRMAGVHGQCGRRLEEVTSMGMLFYFFSRKFKILFFAAMAYAALC